MSQTIAASCTHAEWMSRIGQFHCRRCDAPNDRSNSCCHHCGRENEDWSEDDEESRD